MQKKKNVQGRIICSIELSMKTGFHRYRIHIFSIILGYRLTGTLNPYAQAVSDAIYKKLNICLDCRRARNKCNIAALIYVDTNFVLVQAGKRFQDYNLL